MKDKREHLEQTAIDAIKKAGLSSISFRTLADSVGVKSSSVHYHFPTKADLTEAVIRRYSEDFSVELNRIQTRHTSLNRRLNEFIKIFEEVTREHDLCLCGSLAADAANLDSGSMGALRTFFDSTERWLVKVIEEAKEDEKPSITAKQFAAILMAGLEGASLVDRALNQTTHLTAFRKLVNQLT